MNNIPLSIVAPNAGIQLTNAYGTPPLYTIGFEQDGIAQVFGLRFDMDKQVFLDELDTPWRTRAINDLIPCLVEAIRSFITNKA